MSYSRARASMMLARVEMVMTYDPEGKGKHSRAILKRWQAYCDRAAAALLDIHPTDGESPTDGEALVDDVDRWLAGEVAP